MDEGVGADRPEDPGAGCRDALEVVVDHGGVESRSI